MKTHYSKIALSVFLVSLFVTGDLVTGCRKDDEDQKSPWPVWILYVNVYEPLGFGGGRTPVSGCPSVVWWFDGDDQTRQTEKCYEGSSQVKVWRGISEAVRIVYYVTCDGYYDSEILSAYFLPPAVQGPGREGAEVIVSESVVLRHR
jgi:hypothetical protein